MSCFDGVKYSSAGEGNNFPRDNEIINFIFKFQKELIKNCEILINHNKSIFESIKNHKITMGKTLNNIKSSVCSHILQEFEKRILEKVFIYCCNNGYIKNNNIPGTLAKGMAGAHFGEKDQMKLKNETVG